METREEHLEWCKKRALEYIELRDTQNAFSSFMSDMSKHPETAGHKALDMGMMLLMGGHLNSVQEMENWITGFN